MGGQTVFVFENLFPNTVFSLGAIFQPIVHSFGGPIVKKKYVIHFFIDKIRVSLNLNKALLVFVFIFQFSQMVLCHFNNIATISFFQLC